MRGGACIDRLEQFFFSDWAAMMEVDTASHDYSPFPSKLFALLFILLNNPRPRTYEPCP